MPTSRVARGFGGLVAACLVLGLAACQLSESQTARIRVSVAADGRTEQIELPPGSTVADAFAAAGLTLSALDRATPPLYTVMSEGDTATLARVEEKFRTETQVLPFDRQTLRNDSLPEGQERLVQAGVNGEQELTYRAVLEDGVQVSEAVVKTVVLKQPLPEIVMVGSQSSFAPLPIPGKLAYLAAGNAWLVETSTANRRVLINSGDLDGRVFALSPDGAYLLYTRKSKKPPDQEINTLWAIRTDSEQSEPISLHASNIVHFAAWYPNATSAVAYSTVEPRPNAPGWQANNDLYRVTVGGKPVQVLDSRSGGVYGWWGMDFAFSSTGRLAYARPDGIGLVVQDGGYLAPLAEIVPFQTHADWAWTPGLAWGPDSQTLYYIDHAAGPPPITPEESPAFDLMALSFANDAGADFVPQVGMFSYPVASPATAIGAEKAYQIAYLQAIFPDQSGTSRYRLMVMDRDGSNRRALFPSADSQGLEPGRPVWAPAPIGGQAGDYLCVVYQGNLWLVDSGNGNARQITGDGLASMVDWK